MVIWILTQALQPRPRIRHNPFGWRWTCRDCWLKTSIQQTSKALKKTRFSVFREGARYEKATVRSVAHTRVPSYANTILIDRGEGLIYDSEQNITWLQDADYSDTTGYDDALYGIDTDGSMYWADAVTWAENLIYQGHTEWRLPETSKICRGPNPCTTSEMGN